jgi:hypothetical protein
MPDEIHGAEPEPRDDRGDICCGVFEPEPVGIPGLSATAQIDRDTTAAVAESFGVLIHRLEVRAAAVEQEQRPTRAAVIPIRNAGSVKRRDASLGCHHSPIMAAMMTSGE